MPLLGFLWDPLGYLWRPFGRRIRVYFEDPVQEELREIEEWKDLIMQNLLQKDLQILEIGEVAVKRAEEELALQQVDKLRVVEEMVFLIPLKNLHQAQILRIQQDLPLDLIGLLKLIRILRTQLFLVLIIVYPGLVEGLHKILAQILLIKDHLLKARIHHPQESRDQEITVQDLMINQTSIIY